MPINITPEFVQQLLDQIAALVEQNANLTAQISELTSKIAELQQTIRELEEKKNKTPGIVPNRLHLTAMPNRLKASVANPAKNRAVRRAMKVPILHSVSQTKLSDVCPLSAISALAMMSV